MREGQRIRTYTVLASKNDVPAQKASIAVPSSFCAMTDNATDNEVESMATIKVRTANARKTSQNRYVGLKGAIEGEEEASSGSSFAKVGSEETDNTTSSTIWGALALFINMVAGIPFRSWLNVSE